MEENNKFCTELKKYRIKSGLTQQQLAARVGVDASYLSRIENGLLPPPSEIILTSLAEALNIDPAKLVKLSGKVPHQIAQELEARAKSEFGPKLRDLRNKARINQQELARKINADPSYISKLENGVMPPPSRKILTRLAAILNTDEGDLMVIAGKMKPGRGLKVNNPFRIEQFDHLTKGVGAMNMKSLARVAVALLLVITVGTSLWFAGPRPVQAVTVSFPSTPAGTQSSSHTFTVRVDIAGATDLLPVQSVDIWVNDPTGANSFTLTGVPLTATTTTFSPSGVGTVSVTAAPGSMWDYATSLAVPHYGYGYGYTTGTWATQNFLNTGYGYGYSTGGTGDTYIVFTVTWTPPSSWPTGTYNTNAIVYGNGGAAKALTSDTPGSFTISAAAAAAGPSGPAAPPAGEPLTADVSAVVDSGGQFTEPLTIESRDGNVTIEIDEGTTGLTEAGRPLAEITVDLVEDPPPPPAGTNVIGVPYDFGPDGATFDPPITMTFSYSPNQLPAGTDSDDLSIAYYDQDSGEWVELAAGDITIDPVTGTITAQVSHFTQFGIIVHAAPAEFEVSGLVYPTMGVNIAEPATISARVANIGDIAGTYQVTLKINGEAVSSKTIKLNGGEYRKVSFTTVQGKAGDYKVEIDGQSGTLTVKAVSVGPVVITSTVPSVTAPAVEYPAPTAPAVPAAPAPVPAPTPWTAIIIVLVVAVIVGGILVWNYGFRTRY